MPTEKRITEAAKAAFPTTGKADASEADILFYALCVVDCGIRKRDALEWAERVVLEQGSAYAQMEQWEPSEGWDKLPQRRLGSVCSVVKEATVDARRSDADWERIAGAMGRWEGAGRCAGLKVADVKNQPGCTRQGYSKKRQAGG